MEAWVDEYTPESVKMERFFVEMATALHPGPNGPFRMTFDAIGTTLEIRVVRITGTEDRPTVIDVIIIDLQDVKAEMMNRSARR
ncbi:MAG: hypothetical protein ABIK28_23065 [Planctomycetota bacterium]